MTGDHPVDLTRGAADTVLAPPDPSALAALEEALAQPEARRRAAVGTVAARWPRLLEAWAALAELSDDPVERYAFARVGYHRGLDALRAAGWRGSGHVRWRDRANRGFLRSLELLGEAADAIGEEDEAARCTLFLRQLDPEPGAGASGPATR
ncbi:MAG TPA: DUF3151 family protein [Acidimicrobiales bacterium]|nr:DUF3151 family protein [Acidimicrobiales bacterium]